MKSFLLSLGNVVLFSIIVLLIYYVLKKFILSRFKPNKWLVLMVAALEFIVPPFLIPNMPYWVSYYVIPGIFIILVIWFMDLSGFLNNYGKSEKGGAKSNYYKYNGKKNDKNIVIKPKAKPNRVKK